MPVYTGRRGIVYASVWMTDWPEGFAQKYESLDVLFASNEWWYTTAGCCILMELI
jgi:hypothetical protein